MGSLVASTIPLTRTAVSADAGSASTGVARSMIFDPTGAIAMSARAAARAMTTVFDGTFCAPMAPLTMCRTVDILRKAVRLMKTNGASETSASATMSAMGLDRRLSGELLGAAAAVVVSVQMVSVEMVVSRVVSSAIGV